MKSTAKIVFEISQNIYFCSKSFLLCTIEAKKNLQCKRNYNKESTKTIHCNNNYPNTVE